MHRHLLRELLLVTAVLASISTAAWAGSRPELDASALSTPPRAVAERLTRISTDTALRRVATVSQTDSRYGVPTFLWAGRTTAPNVASGARLSREQVARTARGTLSTLAGFYGLSSDDVRDASLRPTHDTGRGGVIAAFRQNVDGVPVFRDELKLMFDRQGGLISASGYLPPASLATTREFTLPAEAATRLAESDMANGGVPLRLSQPTRTRKVYFHMPGALVPAYHVEVLGDVESYSYVVSATDGTFLFRHDLTASDAFSFRVWADAAAPRVPTDGPQGSGWTPHPSGTPDFSAPGFIAPILITQQNGPISTNDPWLAPGATQTTGNNVDAYADLASPDGFSAGDLRATTTAANTFDRTYDTALAPNASSNQRMAAITQLFYLNNFLHDWFYDAGFDEPSGNAQTSNFGRGGLGADALLAEAQDYSGTNNANMSTPSDGASPRMQMYVFNLTGLQQLTVTSPPAIAGNYSAGVAAFGPTTFSTSGQLILANDGTGVTTDACTAITNSVSGKIVLIDRGTCTFSVKVQAAQNAGAIGVIIVDNVSSSTPPALSGSSGTITIPSLSVTLAVGNSLKTQLGLGTVNVTLARQPSLSRDGTLDNQIVAHEWGHYISNRLVGDASGLSTNMSGGLGEGWGDFHALLITVRDGDQLVASNPNFNGVYGMAGYALYPSVGSSNAYYFGIRRVPYSTSFSINGLTYRHIANGQALPVGPPTRFGADGSNNAEVHNAGEVWCTMLWECYAALLRDTGRLTFAQAQERMRDYLVTSYKLTPNAPTLLDARDALLAAAAANDPADLALFWGAFARRGAGVGAISPDRFSSDNVGVVESYAVGGDLSLVASSLSAAAVSCDSDGYIDAGETGVLALTVRNVGSQSLSNSTVTISSTNPGVQFPNGTVYNLGNTSSFTEASLNIPLHVNTGTAFGTLGITVTVADPGMLTGSHSYPYEAYIQANELASGPAETVEAVSETWSFLNVVGSDSWSRRTYAATDHRFWVIDAGSTADLSLISPSLQIAPTGSFRFTFQHSFSFEKDASANYDGGVLEITTDNGASWTDIGASATPSYGGTLFVGSLNPLGGRSAYVGNNAGYPALQSVTVDLGVAYAGQTVKLRFRHAADAGVGGPGWSIAGLTFENVTNQPFLNLVPQVGDCTTLAVGDDTPRDLAFALSGPHPVRGSAEFRFALPTDSHVTITLHDLSGRRVATLADGEYGAGRHTATWRSGGEAGLPAAGVYFARMTAGEKSMTQRVVVVR